MAQAEGAEFLEDGDGGHASRDGGVMGHGSRDVEGMGHVSRDVEGMGHVSRDGGLLLGGLKTCELLLRLNKVDLF